MPKTPISPPPRLFQIILTDFLALDMLVLLVGVWGLYGASLVSQANLVNPLLGLALAISTVALPLEIGRVRGLQRVYFQGETVLARIAGVYPNGSRVKLLECVYHYAGKRYQTLHTVPMESEWRVGNVVRLLIDPHHPEKTVMDKTQERPR